MKIFRTDYPLTPSADLILTSMRLLRDNIWPVLYLTFLPTLVTVVGSVLLNDVLKPNGALNWTDRSTAGLLMVLAGGVWVLLTFPGSLIMQLDAVRGKHPTAMDCFKRGLRYVLPMIGTIILIEICILAGLFAFIIPGLILVRSFYLAQYYVVDQQLGPRGALKKSRAESKPNAGYIWGILGIVVLFTLFSSFVGRIPVAGYILSLIVGLLYSFAPAYRYNEIKKLKLPEQDTPPAAHHRTT